MALTQVSRGLLSTSIVDNGNATAITIDSSEQVGIGTTAPERTLHVDSAGVQIGALISSTSTTSARLSLMDANTTSSAKVGIGATGDNLGLYAGGVAGATLDSSGNVGIGTSGPSDLLDISANGTSAMRLSDSSSPATYAQITQANGVLSFNADAGGAQSNSVMKFLVDNSEAMRIDASGNLLVGTTSSFGGLINVPVTTSDEAMVTQSNSTSASTHLNFRNSNGFVGSISTSGSATAYNTSSDQRLKENIADADDAGSKVDAIQVRKFDWIADGSHQDYGMVAQELQSVAPEAVSAPEDPDEMMGVDYSKLVPMLVKEIQSLRARVAQLENN